MRQTRNVYAIIIDAGASNSDLVSVEFSFANAQEKKKEWNRDSVLRYRVVPAVVTYTIDRRKKKASPTTKDST